MTNRLPTTKLDKADRIPDDLWGHRMICQSGNLEDEAIKANLLGGVIMWQPDADTPFYITGLPIDCPIPYVLT